MTPFFTNNFSAKLIIYIAKIKLRFFALILIIYIVPLPSLATYAIIFMFLASKLSVFIALHNKVYMKHLHQTNQTLTIIILVYFYLFTFGFNSF